jgi:hypothetical protein
METKPIQDLLTRRLKSFLQPKWTTQPVSRSQDILGTEIQVKRRWSETFNVWLYNRSAGGNEAFMNEAFENDIYSLEPPPPPFPLGSAGVHRKRKTPPPETMETLRRLLEKRDVHVVLISDPNHQIYQRYYPGIVRTVHSTGGIVLFEGSSTHDLDDPAASALSAIVLASLLMKIAALIKKIPSFQLPAGFNLKEELFIKVGTVVVDRHKEVKFDSALQKETNNIIEGRQLLNFKELTRQYITEMDPSTISASQLLATMNKLLDVNKLEAYILMFLNEKSQYKKEWDFVMQDMREPLMVGRIMNNLRKYSAAKVPLVVITGQAHVKPFTEQLVDKQVKVTKVHMLDLINPPRSEEAGVTLRKQSKIATCPYEKEWNREIEDILTIQNHTQLCRELFLFLRKVHPDKHANNELCKEASKKFTQFVNNKRDEKCR